MNDKDQAAIAHVASVSKNPNAAILVEWLITGWEAEILSEDTNSWNPAGEGPWRPEYKYRLVPPKPAYRVYRVKHTGQTFSRDSEKDGARNNVLTDHSEWISDWIEYDPPKRWPTPLVERIAAIDIKAAEWIVENWDNLLEERYTQYVSVGRSASTLHEMFGWEKSPQGKEYWKEIAEKLGE